MLATKNATAIKTNANVMKTANAVVNQKLNVLAIKNATAIKTNANVVKTANAVANQKQNFSRKNANAIKNNL